MSFVNYTIVKSGVRSDCIGGGIPIPAPPHPHSNPFRRWCDANFELVESVTSIITDAVCSMPVDGYTVTVDQRLLERHIAAYIYNRM
jgi:hypothetical protein